MFTALANLADRRARRVVIAAVVVAVVAAALGGGVASRLASYGADDPATDSIRAQDRIAEATGLEANPGMVVLTPVSAKRIDQIERVVRSDRSTGRIAQGPKSRDGHTTYLAVTFKDGQGEDAVDRLRPKLDRIPGAQVGGMEAASLSVNKIVGKDLAHAELLAFPLLFLLSLWFFRSVVAALLPPLVGGVTIVITFLALRLLSGPVTISVFALNLVTGLGLGLAIDYSLFIVSRYREEIVRSGPGRAALVATLNTAGRTVLFSSLTVAAALASLLVFPQRFLYSMGIGGVLVALIAATVALVLLPAVLALLGPRIDKGAFAWLKRAGDREARGDETGFWYRLSRFVMRRPGRIAIVTAAFMIVLGLPFLRVQFTTVDSSVLPRSDEARMVDNTLARDFQRGRTSPITVVTETTDRAALARYADRLRALPGVSAVESPRSLGDGVARIDVVTPNGELSDGAQAVVDDIRSLHPGFTTLVGGRTAGFVDQKASLGRHIPYALAIVAIATLVVLFLMTGSVVLPLKSIVMNMLTLSAAFGVLVFVFQDGRLEGPLGYSSLGALDSSQPVVLFAVAFGLSTDYGVFLLGRIKEARDRGASDREAVAIGIARTGRIITAAAVLFCVAIGAFATSRIIFIKELGLGTALAVLLDATIIRALLVPSLMELLGKWNWWAPRPLRRLHERIGLSEIAPPDEPRGSDVRRRVDVVR